MPQFDLKYDGFCKIRLKVNIHGSLEDITALMDTGFTRNTGFALKLPFGLSQLARYHGAGRVALANDEPIAVPTIHDARIVEIEGEPLGQDIILPALFLGQSSAIGVMFLERYLVVFDGPNRRMTITI